MSKLSQYITSETDHMKERRNNLIRATRLAKLYTRKLRNLGTPTAVWASYGTQPTLYMYFSLRVKSMKECAPFLSKIEAALDSPVWTTEDDKNEGTRRYEARKDGERVSLQVVLTAIPSTDSNLCRKVVVGERTSTITSPVYEIVCSD